MSSGTIVATEGIYGGGPSKKNHSACSYSPTHFLSCRADVYGGNYAKQLMKCRSADGAEELLDTSVSVAARGMHYFYDTDELVFCNGDNDKLQKITVSDPDIVTDVAVGSYHSVRGEITNTYLFGWKIDGETNQIFRMDPDGTNEVSVDTETLLGTNDVPLGFTMDYDNELLFFHDKTNRYLRSVSWDLTSDFATYTLLFPPNDWGDIVYSQGFIYYAGIDPSTQSLDSKFYRFNTVTEEIYTIDGIGESLRGGSSYTPDLFIDHYSNKLIISGEVEVCCRYRL